MMVNWQKLQCRDESHGKCHRSGMPVVLLKNLSNLKKFPTGVRGEVFGENISFTVNCAEGGPTIEGVHLLSLLTVA